MVPRHLFQLPQEKAARAQVRWMSSVQGLRTQTQTLDESGEGVGMNDVQWHQLIVVLSQIAEALGKVAGAIIIGAVIRAFCNK